MSDDRIRKWAEDMRKAMEGAGTKEETLIEVAAATNVKERLKIREMYKSLFGRDLMEDLKKELSFNFKKLMIGLYTDPAEYDAFWLNEAMKGMGTNEKLIIEILGTRPDWFIKRIKKKYKDIYGKELENAVKNDTSGDFRKLLVSILQCNRRDNRNPDISECQRIANELYQAGEKKLGTDEPIFNKYFALLSPAELAEVARQYNKISQNTLDKAVDKEFSGDIKTLLQTILYSKISPSEFYATKFYKATKGAGTDDEMLIRISILRADVDMPVIRQYFSQLYNKDMIDFVKDDVSGDYGKMITLLVSK